MKGCRGCTLFSSRCLHLCCCEICFYLCSVFLPTLQLILIKRRELKGLSLNIEYYQKIIRMEFATLLRVIRPGNVFFYLLPSTVCNVGLCEQRNYILRGNDTVLPSAQNSLSNLTNFIFSRGN